MDSCLIKFTCKLTLYTFSLKLTREKERERDRQADRQTDREETYTDKERGLKLDSITNIDTFFQEKMFQTFIYINYRTFNKHRCSNPTGLFYAFCFNDLK